MKLKGIDGGPHKRRNMWFNSMMRRTHPETGVPYGAGAEVLHGCRQLVP